MFSKVVPTIRVFRSFLYMISEKDIRRRFLLLRNEITNVETVPIVPIIDSKRVIFAFVNKLKNTSICKFLSILIRRL